MTYKITLLFALFLFNISNGQTIFQWETATDNGDNITETIDGITVTFTGTSSTSIFDAGGFGGTSGNTADSSDFGDITSTSATISFSSPVDVASLIAVDGYGSSIDFTFTPTGGSNSPVVSSLVGGVAPTVNLNWTEVTSFSISSPSDSFNTFIVDDLEVSLSNLSIENNSLKNISVFPNPVQDFLYISNVNNLKTLKLYNSLGQLVITTNENVIGFSNLNNGIYILQIITEKRMSIKKIVKE